MRTHAQIIDAAGGYKILAERLTAAGHPFTPEQTRFWARRGTIPPERWPAIAATEIATVEELTNSFAAEKLAKEPPRPEQNAAA